MSFDNGGTLYCYVHPQRETHLRCNRCERPICSSCAVLTPTGYRCKECVRGQQKKFDTTKWWDYPVAILAALVLSAIGSYFVSMIGFFTLFLAPLAGMGIAEAVRFLVRRRRSRTLPKLVAAAIFLGGILLGLFNLIFAILAFHQFGLGNLVSLLWPAVYAILATSTAFYRLKGITI
ncbi:MAG: hypothetical protein AB9897_03695 [Anaerolineaceae bacterium]